MTLLIALPVAAEPFVEQLTGFLGQPSGASVMFLHGRDATGTGPAFNFGLDAQEKTHLDLGLITSNRGNQRMVPGLSVDLGRNPSVQPYVGIALTPSEYGGTRLGPLQVDGICFYGGLRRSW